MKTLLLQLNLLSWRSRKIQGRGSLHIKKEKTAKRKRVCFFYFKKTFFYNTSCRLPRQSSVLVLFCSLRMSHAASLHFSVVSILLFLSECRRSLLFVINSLTPKFPQFLPRNLAFLVMYGLYAVSSPDSAAMVTASY